MNTGQRFRELRESKGLTQQDVADKIGKTRNEVSRLESPASNPTVNTLLECCWAIGVTLPEFFESQIPSDISNPEHRELHEQLQGIIGAGGELASGIKVNLRAIWALAVAAKTVAEKGPKDSGKTPAARPHRAGKPESRQH